MTRAFWLAVAERAAKTFAQALVAVLTAAAPAVDILSVDWAGALSVAATAAALSVLTSLATLGDTPGKHSADAQ